MFILLTDSIKDRNQTSQIEKMELVYYAIL